ncbi:MAG: ABC transporter permease [Leptospirillia bacterium]
MRQSDLLRFAIDSIRAGRLRSLLTATGIAVGIASVVLLTSIGEGVKQYVLSEFTQFGTHLIAITPGKTETLGLPGGILSTVRPLTVDDAAALQRVADVEAVAPGVFGMGRVEAGERARSVFINGVDHNMPAVWQFEVAAGRFLPPDEPRTARPFAVLGSKVKTELFGDSPALGGVVRVGGSRFRVVGVMVPKGEILGFDMDDAVYVPVQRALEIFGRDSLMEVDVLYRPSASEARVVAAVKRQLTARHGREDFTVITQSQMLDTLGRVLSMLTFAVAALGGISLLVGSVGIATIMTIAVNERSAEVGLLRSVGASRHTVMGLFLSEAVLLSVAGGLCGILIGVGGAQLLGLFIPKLPVTIPWLYSLLALTLCFLIGVTAGVLPARRAARLDPVDALRAE